MKNIYFLILLIGITCLADLKSQPLALPETNFSLLSSGNPDVKPIELNMNFVPDGENSKLEIGVVCNKTLGNLTLFANIVNYANNPTIGEETWLKNYIKTVWTPAKALMSFPKIEGVTINCKEGAIYHFEYKFNWEWTGTYNSIIALVYVQNPQTKEVPDVIRSSNILYSEFNPLQQSKHLTVATGKDSYSEYIITNPTKENITYEAKIQCSNLAWKISLDKYIIKVPSGFSDTIALKVKTTPHAQYGNVTLTVTPMYLKDSYSVAETRTIVRPLITDDIEFLGLSNDYFVDQNNQGIPTWQSYIFDAVYAQPEIGQKSVFMDYRYWDSYFADIDYDILYIFGKSDNYAGWGTGTILENAALNCIAQGKQLIISSNVGLSIYNGKFGSYKASAEAKEFYQKLGIEYRGYIDLPARDTVTLRVVNKHQLNDDINNSTTIINTGHRLSKRLDYIGITGTNTETFPFLWFNRKYEPANSYAAVATVIGNSKIIYLAPGLETIGGTGDSLLMRNFLRWMITPTSVTETNQINEYNIYPNPADKFIDISSINPTLKHEADYPNELQIFNSLGENVTALVTRQDNRIFIENLSVGSYYCLIRTGDKTICKPFIVKR